MSLTKNTKSANRKGVDWRVYKYSDNSLFANIDYANSVSIDLSADRVFATGGMAGANQVGFDNPIQGTVSLSTQIVPVSLIAMAAADTATAGNKYSTREVIACTTAGSITLSSTPVAGSVYVYAIADDLGTSVAGTVTGTSVAVEGATVGAKYIAYYFIQSETGFTVNFNNDNISPYFILDGNTIWNSTEGETAAEHHHFYKVQPKKAFSITYQGGTGDPLSLDMSFDVYADDAENVYDNGRI